MLCSVCAGPMVPHIVPVSVTRAGTAAGPPGFGGATSSSTPAFDPSALFGSGPGSLGAAMSGAMQTPGATDFAKGLTEGQRIVDVESAPVKPSPAVQARDEVPAAPSRPAFMDVQPSPMRSAAGPEPPSPQPTASTIQAVGTSGSAASDGSAADAVTSADVSAPQAAQTGTDTSAPATNTMSPPAVQRDQTRVPGTDASASTGQAGSGFSWGTPPASAGSMIEMLRNPDIQVWKGRWGTAAWEGRQP